MRKHRIVIPVVPRVLSWLLLLHLVFLASFSQARPLTEKEVRLAVQTWVRQVTAEARPEAVIDRMEPFYSKGEIMGYIAHLQGGGYCLCGGDDLTLPVYFYSPRGIYDSKNPGNLTILHEIILITQGLQQAQKEDRLESLLLQPSIIERKDLWGNLKQGFSPKEVEIPGGIGAPPGMMEIPFTSQWGQGSPYNDLCPVLTPGSNETTLVGCVATAIAQVMYYWKWPPSGLGNRTVSFDYRWRNNWDEQPLINNPNIPAGWNGRLQWTSNNGGRLQMNGYWDGSVYESARQINQDATYQSALETLWNRLIQASSPCPANFGAAIYNWTLMQNQHADPVDPGDAEVAELSYQVAVAVNTGFGIHSSGSDLWRVVDVSENRPIVNYFRYHPDAHYLNPRDIAVMVEEIQWLRPVPFGGGPPGHAWVIYGYNMGTNPYQFKMNMGWDGSSDGWYSLDQVPRGIIQNHNQLAHVAPADVVRFVLDRSPGPYPDLGDGSPGLPFNHIEEALSHGGDGVTLIFKAGTTNTFAANSLIIDRPLVLKGHNVTIQKQ